MCAFSTQSRDNGHALKKDDLHALVLFFQNALSLFPHAGGNGRVFGLSKNGAGFPTKVQWPGWSVSFLFDHLGACPCCNMLWFKHVVCLQTLHASLHPDYVSSSLPSSEKGSRVFLLQLHSVPLPGGCAEKQPEGGCTPHNEANTFEDSKQTQQ